MSDLTTSATVRRKNLGDLHEFQRFLDDHHHALSWISDMTRAIQAEVLGQDVSSADGLLHRHTERRSEIDARQTSFQSVAVYGKDLLAQNHPSGATVQEKCTELESAVSALETLWQARQVEFEQFREAQVFLRDADQMDAWIGGKETELATDNYGDSLESVESLQKKHDDFQKSVDAQEEKKRILDDMAHKIVSKQQLMSSTISSRLEAVTTRRQALVDCAARRRAKLAASMRLQEFKRDADETAAWIFEKLQTASDENYREPTNLRGKTQRHQAFDAELTANQVRIKRPFC
jgi:spectrin alpha